MFPMLACQLRRPIISFYCRTHVHAFQVRNFLIAYFFCELHNRTPILWALKLIQRARTEGKITIEPPVYANLISSFDYIEGCNRKILNYGWINFPLAYTQVGDVKFSGRQKCSWSTIICHFVVS